MSPKDEWVRKKGTLKRQAERERLRTSATEGGAARDLKALSVNSILTNTFKSLGLDREIARYNFVMHWKEVVGEEIAKRTRPECIRNKALVVRVTDSAWAQELSFHKDVILKRLKRFLPQDQNVEDLQFYVGD